MKLVTAIVHNEDAATLVDALLEKEYRATRFNSSGGFLKQGKASCGVGPLLCHGGRFSRDLYAFIWLASGWFGAPLSTMDSW